MKSKIISTNLQGISDYITKLDTDTVLFVIDSKVYLLYQEDFDRIIEHYKKKKRIILWKCAEGEKTKTFTEYHNCIEFFLEKNVHRNSHLIAIGGGATTDFGGFVAATLLRGIRWTSVPTTLLGMIDAGVGGKTGINSKSGKNLVGAFHLPGEIIVCNDFLASLPENEIKSGLGEMMKYALLHAPIYEALVKGQDYQSQIVSCTLYKQQIVEDDFLETSKRKYLNLGHTFGHGIERIYNLPHGVAVIWGMALLFRLLNQEDNLNCLKKLLDVLNWEDLDSPWQHKSFPNKDLFEYLNKDKKRTSNVAMDLVIIEKPGVPKIKQFFIDDIEKILDENEQKLRTFNLRS